MALLKVIEYAIIKNLSHSLGNFCSLPFWSHGFVGRCVCVCLSQCYYPVIMNVSMINIERLLFVWVVIQITCICYIYIYKLPAILFHLTLAYLLFIFLGSDLMKWFNIYGYIMSHDSGKVLTYAFQCPSMHASLWIN